MSKFYKMEIKKDELSRIFADLSKAAQQATVDAINKTTRKVNKEIRTHISTEYNVPKSATQFGKLVRLVRANARTGKSTATIFIRRKGRGLYKYGATKVLGGVQVTIKKTARLYKGAFIAEWKKGQADKFVMQKGTDKYAGKVERRGPTGKGYTADKRMGLWGPQIAELYTNRAAEKVMLAVVDREFQPLLDAEFIKQFEKGRF